ncbi:MAG: PEP-utilizing enzyme [Polyangiales bacterium]
MAQTPADVLDLTSDEILVVARADVGWSPFFTVARAVVTELGGPLSHAAIVLREYGVPAVVNVPQATRILRTGDRVVVDGDRGRVTVLERAPDADASADGQTS